MSHNDKCVAQGPGRVKKCLQSRTAKLRLVHRTWRGRMGQGGSPQPRRLIKASKHLDCVGSFFRNNARKNYEPIFSAIKEAAFVKINKQNSNC